MQFNQRQWTLIGAFAVFWTAFMLFWNGDYSPVRVVILFVIGLFVALAWGWSMKKWGGWKNEA